MIWCIVYQVTTTLHLCKASAFHQNLGEMRNDKSSDE